MKVNIPVGNSNFREIRENGYYYVDKTGLIQQLLENDLAQVTLITRPRRFGKTLGMSMLSNFFDIRIDSKELFEGLEITKNTKLCNQWMNKYPVLFISFKDIDGLTFENAYGLLEFTIAQLCEEYEYLERSDKITQTQKEKFIRLKSQTASILEIDEELTYDYIHSSEENLWSILYLTGYLTTVRDAKLENDEVILKIPNAQIKEIFETTVRKWFDDYAKTWNRTALFEALWNGNSEILTKEISTLLRITISYHDYREDFYHAFLAGIFTGAGYRVESNREHGEGRSDIVIFDSRKGRVAIFEVKYSKELKKLEESCKVAIDQIDTKFYVREFEDEYDEVLCYGIAFYKKRCVVKKK